MASATSPNSYVLFTAYEITSAYLSQGICITSSGAQIHMEPYFSINKPPNADPTAFQSSASTKFIDYLGFSTCAPGVSAMVNIPTDSALPSSSPVKSPTDASLRSANSSNTIASTMPSTIANATIVSSPSLNKPSSGISTRAKIAIGSVIPVISIASLSFIMIYLWRKRKRSQLTKSKNDISNSSDDTQPYLQQKAELDSEERRRLELDAQDLRYEMDGAEGRYEIQGSDVSHEVPVEKRRHGLLSLGQTHELRGEEHSQELEGPELL